MKRIKSYVGLTALCGCLVAASSVQANLVVNPGFEIGVGVGPGSTAPPWTLANAERTAVPADVHTGLFAAQLDPIVSAVTQTIVPPLIGGTTYALDFWAKSDGVGALTITLDSVGVATIANPPTVWTHYVYAAVTPLTPGDLSFFWSDGVGPAAQRAFIDDVNLVPVPEPTTVIAGALLLLPFAASTLRFMRKTRVA
jgi:hypothetical protein